MQKTQFEFEVASGADLEAQHFALSKSKDARSCRQQLESVEEQLDLACEKVISLEAAKTESAV